VRAAAIEAMVFIGGLTMVLNQNECPSMHSDHYLAHTCVSIANTLRGLAVNGSSVRMLWKNTRIH
jgi:hypothetical protein